MAERICPWWLGYLLVNPIRKLWQSPKKILTPYVKEGMRILDVGSGMGFFSIPLALMAGSNGRVICVDLQDKMLSGLMRRAIKAGVSARIEARKAQNDSLRIKDVAGTIDFAMVFAVIHEIPDKKHLFEEISAALKPGGRLLISEPRGHVNSKAFEETVNIARKAGLEVAERPFISLSYSAILKKNI